jgi:L-gulonolactone oxidase
MFGVVTGVAVRAVPAFLLEADEHAEPVEGLLGDFDARMGEADHVEFYWFPHTSTALVKSNTRVPMGAATRGRLPRWRFLAEDELVNNGVFGASCYVGFIAPQTVPTLNRIAARLVAARRYADLAPRVFTSPRRVRFREMEYAIPFAAVPEVVREIDRVIRRRRWRISFPLEVRVAAGDDAWLSPAYGRRTGYVAVHRFHREPFAAYFRAVEDIALAAGGRPHWGKLHTATGTALAGRYPRFADAAVVRRRVDPGGLFSNRWVRRLVGTPGADLLG